MASPALVSHALGRRRFLLGLGGALALASCGTVPASPIVTPAPSASVAPAQAITATPTIARNVATAGAATVAGGGPTAAIGPAATATRGVVTAVSATPATALRLLTLAPAELGAPAIPAAAASVAASPQPYVRTVAPFVGYGTDAPPGTFPRTVRHARGALTIPSAPGRVVVLGQGEIDTIVALGMVPVGYGKVELAQRPAEVRAALQAVPTVGTPQEPDLEAIAALRPDLILANIGTVAKIYPQLAALAPVVSGEGSGIVWRQNFALYAQALGREREGAAVVARYEERARWLNARLPNPRPRVSIVRVMPTNLRYMWRTNFAGLILSDLGFPRVESQNIDDFGQLDMPLESLGQYAPGDLIVLAINGGDGNAFGKDLLASSLWQSLDAVRAGRVLQGADTLWMLGVGYQSALGVLDDLARHFNVAG
jgi:iron complex transport system substrate-binding protein